MKLCNWEFQSFDDQSKLFSLVIKILNLDSQNSVDIYILNGKIKISIVLP